MRDKKTRTDISQSNILLKSDVKRHFVTYITNKITAEYKGKNLERAIVRAIKRESHLQEFLAKAQFLQHKLGMSEIEDAMFLASDASARSYDPKISADLFDNFLHFVARNEKNPLVLKLLINNWIAQGRSIDEKDEHGRVAFEDETSEGIAHDYTIGNKIQSWN